ncbi:hypothetical protein CR105_18440 [Massilia eurypsychrophila]|uniref:Glucose-methanol-choline oxidoreductase N-terminal domain-containing protein n=1 Tax=Massilia eurypsychrophila TaxID=1485217 RepID=A0A2G8TBY6_9BURK|nr:GMC family oxidoreductase N-terminal domain-containing protein [Massilia eurypsychrophila]PIL43489.1 hypothetical protein CR105_18440 [Massilia eurypsychrophila]
MKKAFPEGGELERGDRINLLEQAMMRGQIDRRNFMKFAAALGLSATSASAMAQKASAIDANQSALASNLLTQYDYIVCGAGSSGCVVASRLSENPDVKVLLIEAGGSDQVASIQDPGIWFTNLGTEREWGDKSLPQRHLNNRQLSLAMGKAVGGGSSINVMAYVRGHKNDFDHWAAEAGDPSWNYQHVLAIYKRIENWQGAPDPAYRGQGGNVWVQPAHNPNPIAPAMMKAAASVGIPSFADHNGAMMEGPGGCSIANTSIKDGRRLNMAAHYLHPAMDRPNLTVLTQAEVQKVTLAGKRATGVEFLWQGKLRKIRAAKEVVLSTGALNSPKLLMLSGIGPRLQFERHVADLIEEQGAAVRLFDSAACAAATRAGVGAVGIAEQLALDQVSGDRAAVNSDEVPPAPGAVGVQRACSDFLSSPRFPAQQHRQVGAECARSPV